VSIALPVRSSETQFCIGAFAALEIIRAGDMSRDGAIRPARYSRPVSAAQRPSALDALREAGATPIPGRRRTSIRV